MSRRLFLQRGALAVGALAAPFNILSAENRGDQVRCALIGCGDRGMNHLGAILKEQVVAIVDVDDRQTTAARGYLQQRGYAGGEARAFVDYRRMFDALKGQLDAVFIATPNHHHMLPAMLALNAGVAVYAEKPLCHNISEARQLRKLAAEARVATQMGNQGHCEEGYRKLCEYVAAGVIGPVRETHSWTNRANGGVGPRPAAKPSPEGLHWEEWIGPATFREFHENLHPHSWHGWCDFGNGSIGNMGCHVLDGVFWALNVEHPDSIEAEQLRGGSDERHPLGARIRWDIPARGEMPALKAYWYEGLKPDAVGNPTGVIRTAREEDRYLPPRLLDLMKQYPDEELGAESGTIYMGDKGVIYTATYGDRMHIVPWEKMRATPVPAKTLPRPQSVFQDFLTAVRTGSKATAASFDYGARLTEFVLLGNLATHAGVGNKVEWDGAAMRVKNLPALNARLTRQPRAGWKA